ncbi:hypothetical protein GDN83_19705 [Gordonia jinghuaiqii]|uniref:3,4-dihydroxy-2-butanone-4-phosphate synthase n=1 Tax=Gordonia jinghuaiqii TaxID=2758710 RepID=A0A7D7LYP5_9ACTN|nr:3,4-dihydroxy-2-butanone-4-phosphate synthase [Gordonia jinghuaiqii]MCR5979940.1 hypothetical protein [Gordonia jinghuaiqii]QMT03139.1 3,4-dihydroxy-2-butanone-4-phosphate synthase [Gordonia jinghuaiqii]
MTLLDGSRTSVSTATEAMGRGQAVVVIDDTVAPRHAALVIAAEHATTELVAFLIRHTGGFLCAALGEDHCERLALPHVAASRDTRCPEQRVTVDARDTGTGISASARARTVRTLADPRATTTDFTRPGHVVPVGVPLDGGVRLPGFAGATIALAALAGCTPVGAYAVLVSAERSSEVADDSEAEQFARRHGLSAVRLSEVWPHRLVDIADAD